MYTRWFIFILLFFCQVAQSTEVVQIETLASKLGVPWGMTLLPDNTMLITEREGKVSLMNLANSQIHEISGLPSVKVDGQGGLFDVALSPDFATDRWLYFSYAKAVDGQSATTLSRAKLDNSRLIEWQDLLITQSRTAKNVHFGGRITFDNDRHVFLSVGDRGIRANAQDLSNHAGCILRLNLDGSIPEDNPFKKHKSALPEIWSYGHRNPQGLFFNTSTNRLWEAEHGPRGGDEINLIESGKNYGWPIISYGKEYYSPLAVGEGTEREGMVQPIKTYIPSIATSSLIQYRGQAFQHWTNNLLVGALKSQHLNRVTLDHNQQSISESRELRSIDGRIRNVIESPEGWLYVSTDDGRILRIKPTHQNDSE